MSDGPSYPRFIQSRIDEALADNPVVLVHGPRQCGKSTFALEQTRHGYTYFTFDDDVSRAAAETDPIGFVDELPDRAILDEVQRVPTLFTSLKAKVDRSRTPGRFLLTGSSNVLLLPTLADSLAGRMEILRLHPLSQSELVSSPSRFLESLFERRFKVSKWPRLGPDLAARIVAGGYPTALTRASDRRKAVWYRDYARTIADRDVRDMTRIRSLDVLPRLLEAVSGQTARLANIADLSGPFEVSRPTINGYVAVLERVFLLDRLPAWHTNLLSRLVKSPKLHIGDTGLGCALLGFDTRALMGDRTAYGQLVETFVFQKLRRLASWEETPISFSHFRDKDNVEVDIVLERGSQQISGIEIKAGATVTNSDFRGLRKLKEIAGKRFVSGVVLYDGEVSAGFGDGLFAVPIRALWEIE